MTVGSAITKIATLKPHTHSDDTLAGWLSDVDKTFWAEVITLYENTAADGDMPEPDVYQAPAEEGEGGDPPAVEDTELLIPAPYDELYVHYLAAQIDFWNGEYGRYNNAMAMFNSKRGDYVNLYNRTHTSKQPTRHEV